MSSKFSDIPYFIAEDFFSGITPYTTPATVPYSAYLKGIGTNSSSMNITARGGYGVNLYIKNITPSSTDLGYEPYYAIKARHYDLDSRDSSTGLLNNTLFTFYFESTGTAGRGSAITYDQLTTYASSTDNSPVEVYFGDDKLLHDFVDNNSEYEGYVNTNKRYLYFGQLYVIGDNKFVVDFNQMFKYATKALPVNDRTENVQIFLETFFDKQYTKIYNSLKNILCQSDPYEMNPDYLYYLMRMFNINTDINMSAAQQRAFVSNLPYYLKRKGTYASLYIVWNILGENTTNLLNVYERWHDWDLTDVPLTHFTDYLYTTSTYYGGSYPNTGAGVGYYVGSTSSVVVSVDSASTSWAVGHGLNDQYPLTQFVDSDDNLILPLEVTYNDANSLTATFGTSVAGKAICTVAPTADMEYILVKNTAATEWIVEHSFGVKYPIVYAIYNDKQIVPQSIWYENTSQLRLTFPTAQEGVVIASTDTDLTVTTPTSGATWTVTHNFNDQYPITQIIDEDDYGMIPDSLTFTNENALTITFPSDLPAEGKVVTFSNTSISYPTYAPETSGGCMSPHYRVEIDLSNEPLLPTAIINEAVWSDLLTYWEELRPVCKYAHYSEIIAPITDFSGNSVSLYGLPNKFGYLHSICCTPTSSFESDTMGYSSSSYQLAWIIKHNFNTKDLNVQCFDRNGKQIYPANIEFTANDVITITFSVATSGYAYITRPDLAHAEDVSSATWSVTHSFGANYQYLIGLVKYSTQKIFMPKYFTMTDTVSTQVDLTTADTGTIMLTKHSMGADWYDRSADPGSEWIVYHGLDSTSVQVQVFDTDDRIIYPKTVTITNNNVVTVSFDEAVAGYAVVKKVGAAGTNMTDVMASVSVMKIGTGGGASWDARIQNDIQTVDASYATTVYKEDTNYYYLKTTIDDGLEHNITEIGVFDASDNILFYSYMTPLYKPENVALIIWYRIGKTS